MRIVLQRAIIEQVFDISMTQSFVLTKEKIPEKYNIELSEEIKDTIVQKKRLKQKIR